MRPVRAAAPVWSAEQLEAASRLAMQKFVDEMTGRSDYATAFA